MYEQYTFEIGWDSCIQRTYQFKDKVSALTKIVPTGNANVLTQPMNDAECKSCCNVITKIYIW